MRNRERRLGQRGVIKEDKGVLKRARNVIKRMGDVKKNIERGE